MNTQSPVMILCGGRGTRMGQLTDEIPKPMLTVGGRPLVHHLMRHFSFYGFHHFILCLGYQGWKIKEYFLSLPYRESDVFWWGNRPRAKPLTELGMENGWQVCLAETGESSEMGERVVTAARHVGVGNEFILTYGDGLADIDLDALLEFHRSQGRAATVTAVHPPARFGGLDLERNGSPRWVDKHCPGEGWINGGFMVLTQEALERIRETKRIESTLAALADENNLAAYRHEGNWLCADTPRDLDKFEELWRNGNAFWHHPDNNGPNTRQEKT